MQGMHELTDRIRGYINNARIQHSLLRNRGSWLQLCSSLDVIGDSDLAVGAYVSGEAGQSDGARYLALYGLLQALFLQQDAVFNMCEALGIETDLSDYPRLREIREIRNESVGHPTKKGHGKNKPSSYHFVSRPTLSLDGFQLLSHFSDGRPEFRDVSVHELIQDQRRYISEVLRSVIGQLESRDKAHKERFSMEKLSARFANLGYPFEKLLTACRGSEHLQLGKWGLESIQDALREFRDALERRGIELDTYDSIKHSYELLEYPLGELEKFFADPTAGDVSLDNRAAYISGCFLRDRLQELREIAAAIDEEYSS